MVGRRERIGRPGMTRADVVVTLVLVLLSASYCLSARRMLTENDRRKGCGSNLRQIGQALMLYANENKGWYPRTTYDVTSPVPTWGSPYQQDPKLGAAAAGRANPFAKADAPEAKYKPAANDVTAALFMLLRTQDIKSEAFVCPSTGQQPFAGAGAGRKALQWTNWPGNKGIAEGLSYSIANPYPSKEAVAAGYKLSYTTQAEFAVAADMNPGNAEAMTLLTPKSAPADLRLGNSINHERDGQNVLYGDGHVEYVNNPFVGIKRDNIYLYGKSDDNGGGEGIAGSPIGPGDSVLLPAASDVGVQQFANRPKPIELQPLKPEQAAAVQKKMAGTYARRVYVQSGEGLSFTLTVTPERITQTSGAVSVAFPYQLTRAAGEEVVGLHVTAPDGKAFDVVAILGDKGELEFDETTGFLGGTWERKRQ